VVAVGAEGQAEEVALMGIFTETVVGKIGDLITFQIQDRDGLMRVTLLRAVSVVQRSGVAIVWTQRNRGRKTVYRSDPARRDIQPFAGWKWRVRRLPGVIRKETHTSD